MKFKEWFDNRLVVSRYPVPSEIEKSDFDIYINVSDEYIQSCHQVAVENGKMYYWFPMNECTGNMGINSIFGALQILFNAEKQNKKVYLHCHAGVNRSPTVKECYYLLRTGNMPELKNSRLKENIEQGFLPSIRRMTSFLKELAIFLELDETTRGGMLDSSKLKARIQ